MTKTYLGFPTREMLALQVHKQPKCNSFQLCCFIHTYIKLNRSRSNLITKCWHVNKGKNVLEKIFCKIETTTQTSVLTFCELSYNNMKTRSGVWWNFIKPYKKRKEHEEKKRDLVTYTQIQHSQKSHLYALQYLTRLMNRRCWRK